MILGTLIVGLVTAYYYGVRPGMFAGGIAGGLFFLVEIVPATKIPAYVVVALGMAAVCWFGPRRERPTEVKRTVDQLRTWYRRLKGTSKWF